MRYIVNRSSIKLTKDQTSVLAKGLKFSPVSDDPPKYEAAIGRIARTIRLRFYFGLDNPPPPRPPFKPSSTWMPPSAPTYVEDYLGSLKDKIASIPEENIKPNLSKGEHRALAQLHRNPSITIKKADKGSCVVVEDTKDYIRDGMEHLSDREIYEEIPGDYTEDLAQALNTTVKQARAKGHISANMATFLTHQDLKEVRTQKLYFLKKIHKSPVAVRPIVSGTSGPTEKASAFIDHYSQPLVTATSSYTKDSTAIIQLLEERTFPQEVILATVDVRSLYLNIPHEEGMESLIRHLFEVNPQAKELPFPRDFIESLLTAILKHNIFEFNDRMFRQKRGTAMGTKMAPAYANLFMSDLETKFLATRPVQPLLWQRFIDDILIIWPSSEDSLKALLEDLNANHPTIKYTWQTSEKEVSFLDLDIHKGERFRETGKLDVRLHLKPTNKFQYLHYRSAHPRSTHRGLIKGEAIRTLRASSTKEAFEHTKKLLARYIVQRGYPRKLVKDVMGDVKFEDRMAALGEKTQSDTQPPAFVCRFHPQTSRRNLKAAILPPIDTPLPIPIPRICYTRGKNLGDTLVRARVKGAKGPPKAKERVALKTKLTWRTASAPCGGINCLCCGMMSQKENVFSSDGGTAFKVPLDTSCSTQKVIYLIECTRCTQKNMYVGQTRRALRQRASGHRAAWMTDKNMPLYRHLHKPGHSFDDLRITIIDRVEDPDQLEKKEIEWMIKLDTVLPKGLNSKFSLPSNSSRYPN